MTYHIKRFTNSNPKDVEEYLNKQERSWFVLVNYIENEDDIVTITHKTDGPLSPEKLEGEV